MEGDSSVLLVKPACSNEGRWEWINTCSTTRIRRLHRQGCGQIIRLYYVQSVALN